MRKEKPPEHKGIDAVPGGGWRARIRVAGKRVSRVFQDFDSARAFIEQGRAFAVRLGRGSASSLTVEECVREEIERREASGRYRGINNEWSIYRTHIKGTTFGRKRIRRLTVRDVAIWFDELQEKPAMRVVRTKGGTRTVATKRRLSLSRVRQARAVLQCTLHQAVLHGHIRENLALGLRVSRNAGGEEGFWTYLEPHEIERVCSAPVIPEWARLLYTVAIFTGLRAGELWGLRWTDIDLEGHNPHIVVRRSHDSDRTKSGKPRYVPLLDPARRALLRWREVWPRDSQNLVFPSSPGKRRSRSDDAGWADHPHKVERDGGATIVEDPGWKTKAGITRHVRFHDLRHTCASMLLQGKWGRAWSLPEIRDLLGHATIEETMRYAHLSEAHLAEAARKTVPQR